MRLLSHSTIRGSRIWVADFGWSSQPSRCSPYKLHTKTSTEGIHRLGLFGEAWVKLLDGEVPELVQAKPLRRHCLATKNKCSVVTQRIKILRILRTVLLNANYDGLSRQLFWILRQVYFKNFFDILTLAVLLSGGRLHNIVRFWRLSRECHSVSPLRWPTCKVTTK